MTSFIVSFKTFKVNSDSIKLIAELVKILYKHAIRCIRMTLCIIIGYRLICESSLDLFPSTSQGWLTAGSAPFRPNPDGVTVDGTQQSPWLNSLCVSQFTWGMDLTPPREIETMCECLCVRLCMRMRNTALIRMCRAQGRTSMPGGVIRRRMRRQRWGGEVQRTRVGDTSVKSLRTHFTKLPALNTPTTLCVCVCNSRTSWCSVVAPWTLTTRCPCEFCFFGCLCVCVGAVGGV